MLLYLGLHEDVRGWKGFNWNATNRLHEKGIISNPVGKPKSVVFTEEGEREARQFFCEMFGSTKVDDSENRQLSCVAGALPPSRRSRHILRSAPRDCPTRQQRTARRAPDLSLR